jgi:hypothetical protein
MNLQVIVSPGGDILWVSGPLPGSAHDKKAEWIWGWKHSLYVVRQMPESRLPTARHPAD